MTPAEPKVLDARQIHKDYAEWREAAQVRLRKWMRDNGATAAQANAGSVRLTAVDGWQAAAEKYAGREALAEAHRQIADLTAMNTRLDHQVAKLRLALIPPKKD